jgi:hypothetical protein
MLYFNKIKTERGYLCTAVVVERKIKQTCIEMPENW